MEDSRTAANKIECHKAARKKKSSTPTRTKLLFTFRRRVDAKLLSSIIQICLKTTRPWRLARLGTKKALDLRDGILAWTHSVLGGWNKFHCRAGISWIGISCTTPQLFCSIFRCGVMPIFVSRILMDLDLLFMLLKKKKKCKKTACL